MLLLTLMIFAVPGRLKYYLTLLLLAAGIAVTTTWGVRVLAGAAPGLEIPLFLPAEGSSLVLVIDQLAAFFVITINITVLIGLLYGKGYLAPYRETMNPLRFSIHYFSYLWLWLSMVMVVMVRDGLSFLIVWEIMALSSFFLVIFEAEKRSVMKSGISYLIQMHVGMFFIMIAFLVVHRYTGEMSFDALGDYFSRHRNLPLFLLFFVGFGIKAGFMPLHTWLPEAHPAAPSHISGVMSGVMIKMGLYGILRVLAAMQSDLLAAGIVIIVFSLASGILGIMLALVQKDLKVMLAYSTIENVGIIGLGAGLGVTGQALGSDQLALLGYAGALLHILNHSLFKSMLFFNAGSVYLAAETRNMEQTGGLIRRMPMTAMLFLLGALAICGLPPFNGFVSEYLIYIGMFNSLSAATLYHSIIIVLSIVALSLIGGLALFCFTRAFGIVFLGEPRSEQARHAGEATRMMIIPQLATASLIIFIGLASPLVVKPLFHTVTEVWKTGSQPMVTGAMGASLSQISLAAGLFVIIVAALLLYRRYHLSRKSVETGPTWGCGYTAVTPSHQYTATSFAYNFKEIAQPLLKTRRELDELDENEIFPAAREFSSHSDDLFRKNFIDKPAGLASNLLKRLAMMQTGQIKHYILYAFLFMLLVLLLTMLNII